jgi:hypothetical protein
MGRRPSAEIPGEDNGAILGNDQVGQVYANIRLVAENIDAVVDLSGITADVVNVSENLADIINVYENLAQLEELGDVAALTLTNATNAANSASAADASADAAQASQSAAAGSQTAAAASQTAAATSATNASNSATAADSSATSATNSATLANTKAGEASTSATAALAAKVAAEAARDDAAASAANANATASAIAGKFIDEPTTIALADFDDLQDLLDYLSDKVIKAPVTVNIGDSVVTHTGLVTFDHPDAHLISFAGTVSNIDITSVGAITSNAAFSHDVVLNMAPADAADAAVGHYIFIGSQKIADVSSSWLEGAWRIIATGASSVTVRVTDARAALSAPVIGAPFAAKIQKSILRWDSNTLGGIIFSGVATSRFENIVFDGQYDVVVAPADTAMDGLTIATTTHATAPQTVDSQMGHASATFRVCSIVRWKGNGVYITGSGTFDLTSCAMCSNGWRGAQAASGGSSIFAKSAVLSGNRKSGGEFETGGAITFNNSTVAGNGEQGIYATGGGHGVGTNLKVVGNIQCAVEIKDAGFWNLDSSSLRENGPYHIKVNGPEATVCVDEVNTAGATTAAFRMDCGGMIYARSVAPTCAEATVWSADADFPGYGRAPNNYGVITTNVSYSSTGGAMGGFRMVPVSGGGVGFDTRPTANGAWTNRFTLTQSNLTISGVALRVTNAAGFGYGTGIGGAGVQTVSKSNGVTLNKICGQVTMHAASLAAGDPVNFTLTNSTIASTDVVLANIQGATSDYSLQVSGISNGSCRFTLRNLSGGALAEALVINFVVIKGANS